MQRMILPERFFFFFNDTATTEIYTLSLHYALPIGNESTNRGEISDAVRLSNGNILFAHQFGVTLITPEKQILWNYDAPPKCETHTAQPIGTNHVIFIQNGPAPKLFVANLA